MINIAINNYFSRLVDLIEYYITSIKGSNGIHAQFNIRNIDSLTIRPVCFDCNNNSINNGYPFVVTINSIVDILEAITQITSNLHEELHHSHPLYLLMGIKSFVGLPEYAPPLILSFVPIISIYLVIHYKITANSKFNTIQYDKACILAGLNYFIIDIIPVICMVYFIYPNLVQLLDYFESYQFLLVTIINNEAIEYIKLYLLDWKFGFVIIFIFGCIRMLISFIFIKLERKPIELKFNRLLKDGLEIELELEEVYILSKYVYICSSYLMISCLFIVCILGGLSAIHPTLAYVLSVLTTPVIFIFNMSLPDWSIPSNLNGYSYIVLMIKILTLLLICLISSPFGINYILCNETSTCLITEAAIDHLEVLIIQFI
jgi:hypothetical protein